MSLRVVFLDIDSVLNDDAFLRESLRGHETITVWSIELARKCLDPVRIARLQRVIDAADAAVVIVSGWRRWAPVEEIAEALRDAGLRAEVLGAVGGVKMSGDLRASATHEWLRKHPDVTSWVVIDDDVRAWQVWRRVTRYEAQSSVESDDYSTPAWLAGRVVHPKDGITDEHADAAIRVLLGDDEAARRERDPFNGGSLA